MSLTIVVEDEKETPVQFYAARGIEASIPAQQIQRIISVDDGAVCEAAENAITLREMSAENLQLFMRKQTENRLPFTSMSTLQIIKRMCWITD